MFHICSPVALTLAQLHLFLIHCSISDAMQNPTLIQFSTFPLAPFLPCSAVPCASAAHLDAEVLVGGLVTITLSKCCAHFISLGDSGSPTLTPPTPSTFLSNFSVFLCNRIICLQSPKDYVFKSFSRNVWQQSHDPMTANQVKILLLSDRRTSSLVVPELTPSNGNPPHLKTVKELTSCSQLLLSPSLLISSYAFLFLFRV